MKTLNEIAGMVGASVAELQQMVGEENLFEIRIGRAKTSAECWTVYDELYDKDEFKHIRSAAMKAAIEKASTFAECATCYKKTVYDENGKAAIDKALVLARTPEECWQVYNMPSSYSSHGPMRADEKAIFAKAEKLTRQEIANAVKLNDYILILETRISNHLAGYREMRKEVGEKIHALLEKRIERADSFDKISEIIAIIMKKGETYTENMYYLLGRDEVLAKAVRKSCPKARTVAECLELARVLKDTSRRFNTLSDTACLLMEPVMSRALSFAKEKEEYREIIKAFGAYGLNEKLDSIRTKAYAKLRLCYERSIANATDSRSCIEVLRSIRRDNIESHTEMKKAYDKAVSLARSFHDFLEIRRGLVGSFEWQIANELIVHVDPIILEMATSYEDCELLVHSMQHESSFSFEHCSELITKARRKAVRFLKKFSQCQSKLYAGSSKELLEHAFNLAQTTEELRWLSSKIPENNKDLRERIIKKILRVEGQMTFKP